MLNFGATVDIPGGPELETPLHEAVQNKQLDFCKLLIEHHANPLFPNSNGITPIQHVESLICQLNELLTNSKSKTSSNTRSSKARSSVTGLNSTDVQMDVLLKIRTLLNQKVNKINTDSVKSVNLNNIPSFAATSFIERLV